MWETEAGGRSSSTWETEAEAANSRRDVGPDEKTVSDNVAEVIHEHGAEALEGFPLTPKKMEILTTKVKGRDVSLTLDWSRCWSPANWTLSLTRTERKYVSFKFDRSKFV